MARTMDPAMVNTGPVADLTECPICTSPHLVETTCLGDAMATYLCNNGHTIKPDTPAAPLEFMPYGPPVPTPEDLLREVGVDPPIWWP